MKIRILLAVALLFFSTHVSHAIFGDAAFLFSESEISELQGILYELNYDVAVDGKMGPETRSVVAKWQQKHHEEATGNITNAQLAFLKGISFASYRWAAIGASTDGAYAAVWNRPDRKTAEVDARALCIKKSSSPEKCVVTRVFSRDTNDFGWVASVHCQGETQSASVVTTHWLISNAASGSRDDSVHTAYEEAQKEGYDRSLCTLRGVVEARGRHK